jgi:hypothetical protein
MAAGSDPMMVGGASTLEVVSCLSAYSEGCTGSIT